MLEVVKRYRCSWENHEGEKETYDQWCSSEDQARELFVKLKEQLAKHFEDNEEASSFYSGNLAPVIETKEIDASDWPTTNGVVVYIEEEYGYRYWLWHTGMTPDELAEWWKSLDSVSSYFYTPVGLPGTVVPADWGSYDDGINSINPLTAEYHEDGEITGTEIFYRWPKSDGDCWLAHIHMDDDSYLIQGRGDERVTFHHAGYDSRRLSEIESDEQAED